MGILLTQRDGFIIGNIAKLLGFIMNGIFEALSKIGIENIGLCIILFTIIIYMILLPMTIKQQKSSRVMNVMNPEIQAIQKKYANKKDETSMAKMQEETQLVYDKYGVSPTGGCLTSVIQLPILFALWPVVQNIPAYVGGLKEVYMPLVNQIMATDGYQKIMEVFGTMSSINISPENYDYTQANTMVDILYRFQESNWDSLANNFPDLSELIYSTEKSLSSMNYFLGINIAETPYTMFTSAFKTVSIGAMIIAVLIPVLAGLTQFLSIKISQKSTNANNSNKDNPMIQQMNMMTKIMPFMSVFMCFTMPSGLGIYWITSAVVRTIQTFFVNKHLDKQSIDDLVAKNLAKAEKKRANKNEVAAKEVSQMAQKSTKNIKTTSNKDFDSYKPNAKPGSLASKANMVSDFNNKNKK